LQSSSSAYTRLPLTGYFPLPLPLYGQLFMLLSCLPCGFSLLLL
jgi:hypothetical protein